MSAQRHLPTALAYQQHKTRSDEEFLKVVILKYKAMLFSPEIVDLRK
jgi:hypothetical protein